MSSSAESKVVKKSADLIRALIAAVGMPVLGVAKAAQVDQGTLSKLVNNRPGGYFSDRKSRDILAVLGVVAGHLDPSRMHVWRDLDPGATRYLFREFLGGRAVARAVFPGIEAAEQLDQMGVIAVEIDGAKLLLLDGEQAPDVIDEIARGESGLSVRGADVIVADDEWHMWNRGELGMSDFESALRGARRQPASSVDDFGQWLLVASAPYRQLGFSIDDFEMAFGNMLADRLTTHPDLLGQIEALEGYERYGLMNALQRAARPSTD